MDQIHQKPGDPILIENIVNYLKANGVFDEFRHDCLADVDTKPSCQNLTQRVDGHATKFLKLETWNPEKNKNELRNKLRRHINDSVVVATGSEHVTEQVITPKITQLIRPRIVEVVYQYLNEQSEKYSASEKASQDMKTEITDSKPKTQPIDPIAEILSFSIPKSKPPLHNPVAKSENLQVKSTENPPKLKKDDTSKSSNVIGKVEKKKDEHSMKILDSSKVKKEESMIQAKISDVVKVEKKKDEGGKPTEIVVKKEIESSLGTDIPKDMEIEDEIVESVNEVSLFLARSEGEDKSTIKIKKEEPEVVKEAQKPALKGEYVSSKQDKNSESSKLSISRSSSADESNQSKTSSNSSKSLSFKIKHETDKHKSPKSQNIKKSSHHSTDISKHKHKDSPPKSSMIKTDKSSSNKHSKPYVKDSPAKSSSLKSEKDVGNKIKVSDNQPLKDVHSSKKISSSSKLSSKHESPKSKHQSKSDKSRSPILSDAKKSALSKQPFESSDISQSSEDTKEKEKHHIKSQNESPKTSEKSSKDKEMRKSKKNGDGSESKKQKNEDTHFKIVVRKVEIPPALETSKISSRSDSIGSTSSASDSQGISDSQITSDSQSASESHIDPDSQASDSQSKELFFSSSEEVLENSTEESDRSEKSAKKKKKSCREAREFPSPPPPPPPSSSLPHETSSSAEMSEQDSSESASEGDDESSDIETDDEQDQDVVEKTIPLTSIPSSSGYRNSVFDILMGTDSSSDFEGYDPMSTQLSSKKCDSSDMSVSSVHTSDLSSSGEDEYEDAEKSLDNDSEQHSNAEKIDSSLDESKELIVEQKKQSPDTKETEKILESQKLEQNVLGKVEETSPIVEPKRELRRERKLNPKYASSEYTSIFNSKKTSFITKQSRSSPSHNPNSNQKTEPSRKKQKQNTSVLLSESDLEANDSLTSEASVSSSKYARSESSPSLNSNFNSKVYTCSIENSSRTLRIKTVGKDKESNSVKRKLFSEDQVVTKRNCRRNSEDSCSSETATNENRPYNSEKIFEGDRASKRKNGNIKTEHVKKNSLSKSNHVVDKTGD